MLYQHNYSTSGCYSLSANNPFNSYSGYFPSIHLFWDLIHKHTAFGHKSSNTRNIRNIQTQLQTNTIMQKHKNAKNTQMQKKGYKNTNFPRQLGVVGINKNSFFRYLGGNARIQAPRENIMNIMQLYSYFMQILFLNIHSNCAKIADLQTNSARLIAFERFIHRLLKMHTASL